MATLEYVFFAVCPFIHIRVYICIYRWCWPGPNLNTAVFCKLIYRQALCMGQIMCA